MTLDELGWGRCFASPFTPASPGETVGRVGAENRGGYVVYTAAGEVSAEVSGKLRHDAQFGRPPGFPAVGDWVVLRPLPGEERATIRAVLPRRSLFARKEAGRRTAPQVIAANVDVVFLVSALAGDLNPRRLERYLTLTWNSGAEPVVVLSKADLCADIPAALDRVAPAAGGVPVHVISTFSGLGLDPLEAYFLGHRTVALLGSSGVGKSTLINRLIGREVQRVQEVRDDGRGRHTTSRRELLVRPGGGLLLDTPGMRELQLWEGDGVETAFAEVEDLAGQCRFTDCTHRSEPGCAVHAAIEAGHLPAERLQSYHKLQGELRHLEAKHDARARAEQKRYEKLVHRAAYKWLREKGR
jgi:ribosome biogenesis GTPase